MRIRGNIVSAAAGGLVLVAHAVWFLSLFSGIAFDDAYISFRYAANLAHGHGLVFNSGERVEGYSNFLWVLLLSPVVAAGHDPTRASQVAGLLASLAALFVAVDALRRVFAVQSPAMQAVLGLSIATCAHYAAWSVGGLESGLYGLLLVAFWARASIEMRGGSERFPGSALLCAGLALARPEGSVVAAVAVALHLVRAWRSPPARTQSVRFACIVFGIVLPYHAWRFWYYGPHLVPNSVHAKVGGTLAQVATGARHVLRNFLLPYLPIFATLVATRQRWRQPEFWTAQGMILGHLAGITIAGGDWSYGRYFAPLMPLGMTIFVASLADWLRNAPLVSRPALRAAVIVLLVVWGGVVWVRTGWRQEASVRRQYVATDVERIRVGKWLRDKMPANTKIGVYAAGQLSYYSNLYTHDMLGLNDAHVARAVVPDLGKGIPGHERTDVGYTLTVVRPEVIVDGHRIPGMSRHPQYAGAYARAPFWTICEVAIRRDFLAELVRQHGMDFLVPSAPATR